MASIHGDRVVPLQGHRGAVRWAAGGSLQEHRGDGDVKAGDAQPRDAGEALRAPPNNRLEVLNYDAARVKDELSAELARIRPLELAS